MGGVVHAPKAATCNGKVYDFFVVVAAVSHGVQGTYVIGDAGLTPHSPARLFFRWIPRNVIVRQLKAQVTLPAVLPHGPLREPVVPLDDLKALYRTVEQNFVDLTQRTVTILQGLTDDSGEGQDKAGQWADGPKFVWRNLSNPIATDLGRSTPVSRAWRRTVSWLRILKND